MHGREADADGSLYSTIVAQFGGWGNGWAGTDSWVYFNRRAARLGFGLESVPAIPPDRWLGRTRANCASYLQVISQHELPGTGA